MPSLTSGLASGPTLLVASMMDRIPKDLSPVHLSTQEAFDGLHWVGPCNFFSNLATSFSSWHDLISFPEAALADQIH